MTAVRTGQIQSKIAIRIVHRYIGVTGRRDGWFCALCECVGNELESVQITTSQRAATPYSAVLQRARAPLSRRRSSVEVDRTWHRNVALTWVLLIVESGKSVTKGPGYDCGALVDLGYNQRRGNLKEGRRLTKSNEYSTSDFVHSTKARTRDCFPCFRPCSNRSIHTSMAQQFEQYTRLQEDLLSEAGPRRMRRCSSCPLSGTSEMQKRLC